MLAGAAALSAGIAALVSSIAPGHTLTSKPAADARQPSGARAAAATANSYNRMPPPASPSDLGLQGPSRAPQPSSSGPSQRGAGGSDSSQVTPDPSPSAASSPAQPAPAPAPQPAPAVSGGS
jgi:hypothetical protein